MEIGNLKDKAENFLGYVLVTAIILECNSLLRLVTCEESSINMTYIFAMVIGGAAFCLLTIKLMNPEIRKAFKREFLPVLILLEGYVMFYFLFGVVRTGSIKSIADYAAKFIIVLPVLASVLFLDRKEGHAARLLNRFANVMSVIAFLNLIVYYTSTFHVNEVYSEQTYLHWYNRGNISSLVNCLNFCFLKPGAMAQSFKLQNLRDFGPFSEPLMFLIPLGTALFTVLFLCPETDKWRFWKQILLSVTIFTVQSTNGLLMLVIAWGLKFLSMCSKKEWKLSLIPVAAVIAAGAGYFVRYKAGQRSYGNVIEFIQKNKHFTDYVYAMKSFWHKPFLGGGYLNDDYILSFFEDNAKGDAGLSNTISVVLGQGGIVLGLLCMIPFVLCLLQLRSKENRNIAVWVLGPLYLYTVTIFHYRFLLILMLAFGYSLLEAGRIRKNAGISTEEDERDAVAEGWSASVPKKHKVTDHIITKGLQLRIVNSEPIAAYGANEGSFWKNLRAEFRNTGWKRPLALGIAAVVLVFYGTDVWNECFKLLYTFQLTIGQSALRVFYAVISLIACASWYHFVWDAGSAASEDTENTLPMEEHNSTDTANRTLNAGSHRISGNFPGILYVTVCNVCYALFYPILYSYVDTATAIWLRDIELIRETLMLLMYFVFITAAQLLFANVSALMRKDEAEPMANQNPDMNENQNQNRIGSPSLNQNMIRNQHQDQNRKPDRNPNSKKKNLLIVSCIVSCTSVCLVIGVSVNHLLDSKATLIADELEPMKKVLEVSDGKVYSDVLPVLYRRAIPGMSGSAAKGNGYRFCRNASILEPMGKELTPLFQEGYQVTKISEDSILYSNDENVITKLTGEGYTFYRYYALAREYEFNPIPLTDELNDQENVADDSLKKGENGIVYSAQSGDLLQTGRYTVTFELKSDLPGIENTDKDTVVCRAQITHGDGKTIDRTVDVTKGDFDEAGNAKIEIVLTTKTVTEKYEYLVKPETDYDVEADKVSVQQTPLQITLSKYNVHQQPIYEAYYDKTGTPTLTSKGYAARECSYNPADKVTEIRYLDAKNQPVMTTDGYAEVRYEYDSKMRVTKEACFDANGEPATLEKGYSSISYQYDSKGNRIEYRYCDAQGNLVNRTDGYAMMRYQYDDKKRWIRRTYYDRDENKVLLEAGYASEACEYNEKNQRTVIRYYGTEDEPILRPELYSEIHYRYDDKGRILRTEYYDTEGNRTKLKNGISAIEYERDGNGNPVYEEYFGTNDEKIAASSGVSSVKRKYNNKNQKISDSYYDIDEKPLLLSKKYSTIVYTYDSAGKLIKKTLKNPSGKVVGEIEVK
ncbi:RHS repeat protein [[Clostridium] aminophilum]|uniref:RHS repeat protein n=1 Tax=[Clostridium] aminophilum TaxID=1526 RepID=UPI000945551C|nr:RHS repeat protein [[Clostridium] aminophilum]